MEVRLATVEGNDDLFATPGAAQDVDVNVFANDVFAVQTAEINAMRRMLSTLPEN